MKSLKWYNVTCDKTKHIIPAQKWLFDKYVGVEPTYLDVGNTPIDNWGKKVSSMLPDDDYIVFGLDDYLPVDKMQHWKLELIQSIFEETNLERFELGWGASKKKGFIHKTIWKGNKECGFNVDYLEYGKETPYKVSCQFSIWKTSALKRELERTTTPWKFEVHGECKAACFKEPVFRWIEESALSNRQPNKVNILGLRPSDVEELQELGCLGNNLIYGWSGATELPVDKGGKKYGQFYK